MPNTFINKFYFIDKFDVNNIKNLDHKTSIIYRNYNSENSENQLIKIARACKQNRYQLFVSNDLKLAHKFKADGIYIPSFNKSFKHLLPNKRKNFTIIGSAHNLEEINLKIKQNCKYIFLSPIFNVKKKNNFLGLNIFRNYTKQISIETIALGGVNIENKKKINISGASGYASISMIKKKAQIKSGPF